MLSTDSKERKDTPIYSGVLRYFPRALAYIAKVSKAGNDKHNPGQPLHWSKGKSNDHGDCIARHLIEAGMVDADDGLLHSGKLAWRALALLETELEKAEATELAAPFELPVKINPGLPPNVGVVAGFVGEDEYAKAVIRWNVPQDIAAEVSVRENTDDPVDPK